MKVIVVGGGISGLTMTLSLHQAAMTVVIGEAANELKALGVGINLQPTAVRELVELGLGEALARNGIATQQLCLFNKFGQLVWSEPRGLAAGYKWPQYSIHRGQLQMLLLAAVRERLGENAFRSGRRLLSFKQHNDRVVATFGNDRTGAIETEEGDVLVGADGIHSTVRRQLYPTEGSPRFAQQVLWRAAVEAEPILDGRTMIVAGHFHKRIVLYPICQFSTPSRMLTNWICQVTVEDQAQPKEDWNKRVSQAKVLAAFGDWRFSWLDMPALIERTSDIYEFPLVDRNPVERWSFGRVTLIGDAAHPMQPTGSQAGSQAVIDARALTAALCAYADPEEALRRYDAKRRPAMNDVTLRNRRFGPEAALQLAEERAPNGFSRLEDVISRDELTAIATSFSAAADLDVESVNNRPSYI